MRKYIFTLKKYPGITSSRHFAGIAAMTTSTLSGHRQAVGFVIFVNVRCA